MRKSIKEGRRKKLVEKEASRDCKRIGRKRIEERSQ